MERAPFLFFGIKWYYDSPALIGTIPLTDNNWHNSLEVIGLGRYSLVCRYSTTRHWLWLDHHQWSESTQWNVSATLQTSLINSYIFYWSFALALNRPSNDSFRLTPRTCTKLTDICMSMDFSENWQGDRFTMDKTSTCCFVEIDQVLTELFNNCYL